MAVLIPNIFLIGLSDPSIGPSLPTDVPVHPRTKSESSPHPLNSHDEPNSPQASPALQALLDKHIGTSNTPGTSNTAATAARTLTVTSKSKTQRSETPTRTAGKSTSGGMSVHSGVPPGRFHEALVLSCGHLTPSDKSEEKRQLGHESEFDCNRTRQQPVKANRPPRHPKRALAAQMTKV